MRRESGGRKSKFPMIVFLNGKFVPEEEALVSVFDRGFLFGDGLFEALLIRRGKPFEWDAHMERLQRGVALLKLALPFSSEELLAATRELLQRNQMTECMVRLSVSRGITERGYSPKNAKNPAVVLTLYPPPQVDRSRMPRWPVITSSVRVPSRDPLSTVKTANKLHSVLARAEADDVGANEAILVNTDGNLAEGTTSNLFWIEGGTVLTPEISCGALPGVTRDLVLGICASMGSPTREVGARPERLFDADGVFLTMTSFGVVEAATLDGKALNASKTTGKIWKAFNNLLDA
jgi:aminodeoxychorismate lyase